MATQEEEYWQRVRKDQARREAGKSARKDPKPGRVRPKNWTMTYIEDPDGYDDLDITGRERIMPRGETEARQAKTPGSPLHNGMGLKLTTSEALELENAALGAGAEARDGISRGTVVEVSSGLCRVALPDRTLLCNLRNSLRTPHSGFSNVLAAGDEVVVSYMTVSHNGHERGMVEAVLPRRSALARPDVFYSHLQQVIVANVDQVLIVAAWREPAFWPELVDRYLIAAARYNLAPIICINKIDLADDADDTDELAWTLAAYQQVGYRVLPTSARTGHGLAALREALAGRTTALAGLSGVGKSSLLSAAEPGLNLRTAEVSDRRHEGRHTTTQVTLHPLAAGGFVADTPGIREFGLAGLKGATCHNSILRLPRPPGPASTPTVRTRGSRAAGSRPRCGRDASQRCVTTAIARSGTACRSERGSENYHGDTEYTERHRNFMSPCLRISVSPCPVSPCLRVPIHRGDRPVENPLALVFHMCRCRATIGAMDLFIIRHAQSTNNALPIEVELRDRVRDPLLTELGYRQAERVAEHLATGRDGWSEAASADPEAGGSPSAAPYGITHLVCSPMKRTLLTAQPISQALDLRPEIWLDIHEHGGVYLDHGEPAGKVGYPGITRPEVLAQFPGYRVPEELTDQGWWHDGFEEWETCLLRAGMSPAGCGK